MKIHCIRHTKVDVAPGICYGLSNVGLAETYSEEKERVSKAINGLRFDKVYSSPLYRCKTLASDLFPENNLTFDHRLKELNFGDWEMKSWDEISKTDEAKKWFDDFVNVRCPNGESFADQILRTENFLSEVKNGDNTSVMIVTHGGIIRAINCLLNDISSLDAFKTKVEYGELLSFEWR